MHHGRFLELDAAYRATTFVALLAAGPVEIRIDRMNPRHLSMRWQPGV